MPARSPREVAAQRGEIRIVNSSTLTGMDVHLVGTGGVSLATGASLTVDGSSGKTLHVQTDYDCGNSSGALTLAASSFLATRGGGAITYYGGDLELAAGSWINASLFTLALSERYATTPRRAAWRPRVEPNTTHTLQR